MPVLVPLVFCSGLCALVYQIGWLRELRLVFGASTYATSAVLAIFMGGLGLGGVVLGRRADRHPSPLKLYGKLELGVAVGALISPFLFVAIRHLYVAVGGATALGQPLAHVMRLALSTLVLGLPTFLMGGALPAAARYAEPLSGGYRRRTALLYGVNALGALCGAAVATFVLLEHLGTRATILSAACLNAAIGLTAVYAAARLRGPNAFLEPGPEADGESASPPVFVYGAAALTGFVFFLMEIVWYRMLSPLFGGSTYSFGLILAVALAGIGGGGVLASLHGGRMRPAIPLFAATCGLEAFGIALAFGLGDRIAVLALAVRPAGDAGFTLFVAGWTLVSAIVVLPAALVAGYQFPLLIGLLGRDGRRVGRDTGAVYLWNTAGAITGALVGGFGLLPMLGALGCWRLAVVLLVLLCAAAVAVSLQGRKRGMWLVVAAGSAAVAILMVATEGPTALWRHSPIGAGLQRKPRNRSDVRAWRNEMQFSIDWEKDGVESAVGISRKDGLFFIVNGKSDGHAKLDAGTQIMLSLIGAILHPAPRSALVIGLGTGSSAGWLGAIDSIERVDVAELEPAVLEVARRCAPVNRDVLSNPKVRIVFGDARELVMTSKRRYDLIVSEPSNPYRAGIASLYTLEFYRAVAERLAPGGIFSQWVQAYSIDADTIGRIAATLAAVFPDVEVWQTASADLLFVCSAEPKVYSVPGLAERVAAEPFRSGLLAAWGLEGVDGLLSGFFATDAFARHALRKWGRDGLNTDDRSPVEFGFIRSLSKNALSLAAFKSDTVARGAHRPAVRDGDVDWFRVDANQQLTSIVWQPPGFVVASGTQLEGIYRQYAAGQLPALIPAWEAGWWQPAGALENLMLAEALADAGDGRAVPLLPAVATVWPGAAAVLEADLLLRTGNPDRALASLERAIAKFRTDPWEPWVVMNRSLGLCGEIAAADPRLAPRLVELLEQPLSVKLFDFARISLLARISAIIDCRHVERALVQFEPNVPLIDDLLRLRADCYVQTGNPLAAPARRELEVFLSESAAR